MSSSARLRAVTPALDLLEINFAETPVPPPPRVDDDEETRTVPAIQRTNTVCPTCTELAGTNSILRTENARLGRRLTEAATRELALRCSRDRAIEERDAAQAAVAALRAQLADSEAEHTVTRRVSSRLTGIGPSMTRVVDGERGWWSRLWRRP